MKRTRAGRPGIRRKRAWTQDPPAGPQDPDAVRAKAVTRARRTGSSRARLSRCPLGPWGERLPLGNGPSAAGVRGR